DFPFDASSARDFELAKDLILQVRKIRGENDIPSSKQIDTVFYEGATPDQERQIERSLSYFKRLANAPQWRRRDVSCDVATSATAMVGNVVIYAPLRGLKDNLAAEAARIQKLQERARKDLEALETRLANPEFARNAPPAVTAKARERAEELK